MIRKAFIVLLLGALPSIACGWTRSGHMLTAAIAYEELNARSPKTIERIMEIMSRHPERAPFEVAVGREAGAERARRMLMEMARWPDDIRGGVYDHPTWHYAGQALVDAQHPPPRPPSPGLNGAAVEAFALNAAVSADEHASAGERAIALCWLFHLVGDIHQPLHAADRYSADYPEGDRGGGLQFVLDPQTRQPTTLHSFWDDAAHRSAEPAATATHARELRTRLPRTAFPELATTPQAARDFTKWAQESVALAQSQVFGPELKSSPNETAAPAVSAKYLAEATATAERRATLAGYRLADLLTALLAR
jgi:hypothetical protein